MVSLVGGVWLNDLDEIVLDVIVVNEIVQVVSLVGGMK